MKHIAKVSVFALPLLTVALYIYFKVVPLVSVEEFRVQIQRDLPRGTPSAKVEGWLRDKDYPCHDIVNSQGQRVGMAGEFQNYLSDRLKIITFFPTTIYYELRLDSEGVTTGDIWVREVTISL